jgi:uncharacterized protein YjbJ (UPF0337 family)
VQIGEFLMAGAKDQIRGKANETVGAVRKKTGQATGNKKLEVKGAVQQMKGKAQGIVGKAKGKLP